MYRSDKHGIKATDTGLDFPVGSFACLDNEFFLCLADS
jgi:hypothetical protein